MKVHFLFAAGSPLVVLASYDNITNPELLKRLASKGISKFITHEVPVESARVKYGRHFDVVCQDLHQTDDLRVLDYSGDRTFKELGAPVYRESAEYQ